MTDQVAPLTSANSAALDTLVELVSSQLADRVEDLGRQGRTLRSLGDLDELATRMVAALPTVHPWDSELGPFYDTNGLSRWLGVTRQALADRVKRGTLLACRTADSHLLYPVLQFDRVGQVRPGVIEAVGILTRAGADGWAIGTWLTTASVAFDGESVVDYLVVHHGSSEATTRVAAAATADSAAWST
ncbi:hypothetical protein [Lapillicoccus sp.]|uniref:hypothetical protein n=1 Tax=Lapillicoccus sp. TaxID=1909287 RepID=UPI0032643310